MLSHTLIPYNISSGGYLEYIIRYTAATLFGYNLWDKELIYMNKIRNVLNKHSVISGIKEDYLECIISNTRGMLDIQDVEEILTNPLNPTEQFIVFVKAYGFKNIQTLSLKLKRMKCYSQVLSRNMLNNTNITNNNHVISTDTWNIPISYIELMACPTSGCVNGSGQLKVQSKETVIERNDRVLHTFELMLPHSMYTNNVQPIEDTKLQSNLSTCSRKCIVELFYPAFVLRMHNNTELIINPNSSSCTISSNSSNNNSTELLSMYPLFHTRYHHIPKLELIAPMAAKW